MDPSFGKTWGDIKHTTCPEAKLGVWRRQRLLEEAPRVKVVARGSKNKDKGWLSWPRVLLGH